MNTNKRPSGRRPLGREKKLSQNKAGEFRVHSCNSCNSLTLPILLFSLFTFLLSCKVEPGPLYGTWADNKGNTLSFFDDNTFSARISSGADLPSLNYSGNYSLLLNSLTMGCTEVELRVVTEWDIRGNILYLNWVTPDGDTLPLTLFKVSD